MELRVGLRWLADGVEIDARAIELLAAIDREGSLKSAAAEVGLSYRHAWELLGRLEASLGQRMVVMERGRGARLTDGGKRLAYDTRALESRLRGPVQRAGRQLARALANERSNRGGALCVCASHDFALDRLAETLPGHGGPLLGLRVQGSLDALSALARKSCDIAGFHIPALSGNALLLEPFWPWLRRRSLRLLHFVDRRQGLIVAKGNPLAIGSLADLSRRKARFVNRQPGSGTRLMLDALLTADRIRPAQITGYRREEFTHAAVAATIAAGAADAGFGIEAAAAQYGLTFVPLASERYFLATGDTGLRRPEAQALLAALGSRWFLAIVRALPGYSANPRPQWLSVTEALGPR